MKNFFKKLSLLLAMLVSVGAVAQTVVNPDEFVKDIANQALQSVQALPAEKRTDPQQVLDLVEAKIFPHVDLTRMTQLSIGRPWREATEEQRKKLTDAFSVTLVRTYSTALAKVDASTTIQFRPFKGETATDDAVVQSVINNPGQSPVQVDYRLQKQADGSWKIYDVNVLGVWLIQNYRTQFAQQINQSGLDGLIASLEQKNVEYFQSIKK